MTYNSNIERQKHAGASKEEKARHNGVDTSHWGNDCPRIAVPEGWEDHQHTQQLIRKYLDNSFAAFNFKSKRLMLFLTEEEQQALNNWLENGHWVVRKHICINNTFKGLCLEVRVRKPDEEWDDNKDGLFVDYNGGIWRVNSSVFREVEILTREEVSAQTKVVDVKDYPLRCNSVEVLVEPVTIFGETVSSFIMYRKQVEEKGIKVGQMVEVRSDGTTAYIKQVVD